MQDIFCFLFLRSYSTILNRKPCAPERLWLSLPTEAFYKLHIARLILLLPNWFLLFNKYFCLCITNQVPNFGTPMPKHTETLYSTVFRHVVPNKLQYVCILKTLPKWKGWVFKMEILKV